MSEQLGWRSLVRSVQNEAPRWATMLPQLPRLLHRTLSTEPAADIERALERLLAEEKRHNRIATLLGLLLATLLAWQIYLHL
jgi:ubiquinone biosynthesis protein